MPILFGFGAAIAISFRRSCRNRSADKSESSSVVPLRALPILFPRQLDPQGTNGFFSRGKRPEKKAQLDVGTNIVQRTPNEFEIPIFPCIAQCGLTLYRWIDHASDYLSVVLGIEIR